MRPPVSIRRFPSFSPWFSAFNALFFFFFFRGRGSRDLVETRCFLLLVNLFGGLSQWIDWFNYFVVFVFFFYVSDICVSFFCFFFLVIFNFIENNWRIFLFINTFSYINILLLLWIIIIRHFLIWWSLLYIFINEKIEYRLSNSFPFYNRSTNFM